MTRRHRATVRELAQAAGLDLDEALVSLWEQDMEYLAGPDSYVHDRHLKRARRTFGIATRAEIRSIRYWQRLLQVDRTELSQLLSESGIALSTEAKSLPNGAVSVLKAEARSRGVDPLTGAVGSLPSIVPGPVAPIYPSVVWPTIGAERDCEYLSEEEVRAIHYALVEDFCRSNDPISPPGVRDENLFGSAVHRPQTALGDTLKYPTIEMAAAALVHALIHNHPFHNGNKRTALVSMLVFLDANGLIPTCNEDDLFRLVLKTAKHSLVVSEGGSLPDREVLALAQWISDHTRAVEKGEKLIPWRKMKKILRGFDCHWSYAGGVGNRLNVDRVVIERGLFGRKRRRRLHTQVFYGDDGRNVQVDTVKKIRTDLHLDEPHGVDSHSFYGAEPSITDFINRYRKTLQRLANL